MATETKRGRRGARKGGKRPRSKDLIQYHERLKILRLDFQTLLEQIQILGHELETDPCLTADALGGILSLIESLKRELETARLGILELRGPSAA